MGFVSRETRGGMGFVSRETGVGIFGLRRKNLKIGSHFLPLYPPGGMDVRLL
jgi:hypothetical protein